MNSRERFIETIINGNKNVSPLKWEFGYWGETMNNWYREGLPKKRYVPIPDTYTSIGSSLYTYAWTSENKFLAEEEYPHGYILSGGFTYIPTVGLAQEYDVTDFLGMDACQGKVDFNLFYEPMFEPRTIAETDEMLEYIDVDGARRIYLKETATIPTTFECVIKDRKSWEQVKEERLSMLNIKKRFPKNWENVFADYRNRDYPLSVGGNPMGYFGALAQLIGYEKLFYMYYDDPALIHDMLDTFTNIWIAVFEEALQYIDIECVHLWDDVSYGQGSMISLDIMNEFMKPYCKKLTSFFKGKGVDTIFVDTDGDCWNIIPFYMECGVTGIYPMEVNCNMDVVRARKEFPELIICGGINKSELCLGKERIDQILDYITPAIKSGRYIPFCDHFVPPEVHFEEFRYYRERLNELIDSI